MVKVMLFVFDKKCPSHNENGIFYEAGSFLQNMNQFLTLGLTLSHAQFSYSMQVNKFTMF